MTERYFTPAEVEALIPALTGIMQGVMEAHAEAAALRERMQAEQQRIALVGGGIIDAATWRAERQRLDRLAERMQRGLGEVVSLGGVPKDVSMGLVDFPHRRAGEIVNLCWKYGERVIRFWHGLDEGYAARRPL